MKRKTVRSEIAYKRAKVQKMKSLTVASWNVCGLRSLLKKGTLPDLFTPKPNILCLNETMLQDKHVPGVSSQLPQYPYKYFSCSQARKGYSGVAVLADSEPIKVTYGLGVPELDAEGRLIAAEFKEFIVVSTYVPNAGAALVRLDYRTLQWDTALRRYLDDLQREKPVVWLGDLNVVHEDIDIYDIRGKEDWACCTPQERNSFSTTLRSNDMIDSFRLLHPTERGYSYYSRRNINAREKKQGWRLDYVITSKTLEKHLKEAWIRGDVQGSDHHPVLSRFEF